MLLFSLKSIVIFEKSKFISHHSKKILFNFIKLASSSLSFCTTKLSTEPPWNICFFGTDEFALPTLKSIADNRKEITSKHVNLLHVVVPSSHNCKVKQFATEANISCFEWKDFCKNQLYTHQYDVGVIVSFGNLIPKKVIDSFPYGILNVHPSLLPRWRGSSPIIHTVLHGDTETGVSIMDIKPLHFDVGPLLLQSRFNISDDITSLKLRDFLAIEGSKLLMDALRNLTQLEKFECAQNKEGITYAHKVKKCNSYINWTQQSLLDVDRQFRALTGIYDLRTKWNGHVIKLLHMMPLSCLAESEIVKKIEDKLENETAQPGACIYLASDDVLCVKCKDTWAAFKGVVFKKAMNVKSFYNGYLSKYIHKIIYFESLDNQWFTASNVRGKNKKKVEYGQI